ncbi:hypothetical protein DZD18_10805 [Rhodobacteraceae bacterium W635]|uniref:hypothetical protein n=1 Tax=Nioella halotolerans TaxID=2303578 RepID=UPI000E3BB5BF|nr:hypothetical protein DZD18_10805 [Rhodobacteraceae bacterium W635]
MILFTFFGSIFIAVIVAILFERFGITRNGYALSILIALGAVIVLFFLRSLFHLRIGSPGLDAIIGASAALILIPADAARRRGRRGGRRR